MVIDKGGVRALDEDVAHVDKGLPVVDRAYDVPGEPDMHEIS